MNKSKKPFKNYIKDFKVENYFENTCGEINNNSLIVKTVLDEDDLSKINNSNINIKNDCVIIIKKDKENMNKITLNDLYNFMKESIQSVNGSINEIKGELVVINKRLDNIESFVEEQKVFNKKQELFNEKVQNFIKEQEEFNNKQEEFNNKQEEFNKKVIKKLNTHEKTLKKSKLL